MAAQLEDRANDYDRDAAAGGTVNASPDELRELAADARAQAQLFRDDAPIERQDAAPGPGTAASDSAPPASDPRASAAREAGEASYDSADRRQSMIAAMEAKGVPPHAIETRMSADAAHATPPSAAVSSTATGHSIQQTRRARSQGRGAGRSDRGR